MRALDSRATLARLVNEFRDDDATFAYPAIVSDARLAQATAAVLDRPDLDPLIVERLIEHAALLDLPVPEREVAAPGRDPGAGVVPRS